MSKTSPYHLSIRLNEAFSSDECRLSCIMCAADILEEALENDEIKELHSEIQSILEIAYKISNMADEFEDLTTEVENKLRRFRVKDGEGDDSDKNESDKNESDKEDQ